MPANPNGKSPLITLADVSKTYVNAAGAFTALKHINLDFYRGEFVGVIGKSGSGKSTLVNMITGIDRPTEGKVFVGEVDIHAKKESDQARWRGLNLGVVFQFFQLLPMLTLIENVLLPMDFCNKYEEVERLERAMQLLELVGLADEVYKLPGAVSGGQQQSAAIARALANDPPIIVADEPTGNLDARTADSVYDLFESLAGEGRTIIMITHDPEIEHRLSRKVLISDGEVIDPALANTLAFLPHPALLQCNSALSRRTFQPGERLDLAGALSDQLLLIEAGSLGVTLDKKGKTKGQVILRSENFFAGQAVMGDSFSHHVAGQVQEEPLQVALLPYDALNQALGDRPEAATLIRHHLLRQVQRDDSPKQHKKGRSL